MSIPQRFAPPVPAHRLGGVGLGRRRRRAVRPQPRDPRHGRRADRGRLQGAWSACSSTAATTRRTWCCAPIRRRSTSTPGCATPGPSRSRCSRRAPCPTRRAARASPARLGGVTPIAPKFSAGVPGSTENSAWTYALHPSMPEVADAVRRRAAGHPRQRRPAGRADDQGAEYNANSVPRPQRARLAQRPAVDLAGARPRGREGRLGRPPRRPGGEQQRQRHLHQHLGVGQRRLLAPANGVPVPGRRRRRDADRRPQRQPVQLGRGRDDAEGHRHGRQPAPVRRTSTRAIVKRSVAAQATFQSAFGASTVDGADDLRPALDRQRAAERPGAAAADRRAHHRRAQRARREPAGLLRLDGRLRHAQQPEQRRRRPARAHLARDRLLRQRARRTSAASTCAPTSRSSPRRTSAAR